jgi:hypothetical protein
MIRIHKIDSKLKTVLCSEVRVENAQSETILPGDQETEDAAESEDLDENDKEGIVIPLHPVFSPVNSNPPEEQTGKANLNQCSGKEGTK